MKKERLPQREKQMEMYELSENNILIADIIIFDGYNDEGELVSRKMTDDERFRKVYTMDGRYFDLATGEEIYECDIRDNGLVYGEVFSNTKYVTRTWRTNSVTMNNVLRAALLYDNQLKTDKAIARGKILLLPRERLL